MVFLAFIFLQFLRDLRRLWYNLMQAALILDIQLDGFYQWVHMWPPPASRCRVFPALRGTDTAPPKDAQEGQRSHGLQFTDQLWLVGDHTVYTWGLASSPSPARVSVLRVSVTVLSLPQLHKAPAMHLFFLLLVALGTAMFCTYRALLVTSGHVG